MNVDHKCQPGEKCSPGKSATKKLQPANIDNWKSEVPQYWQLENCSQGMLTVDVNNHTSSI